MPHYYRVTNDISKAPLYDVLDDDASLINLKSRTFGPCSTGQINLQTAVFVAKQSFHCTAPPADIQTIIYQLP